MPTALATFLVSVGVGTLAASVIATAVTIAIAVGLQAIFGPNRPKPSDGQQEVRQAVGSRRRHYGIVHTGGQVTFFESRNGTLAKVITLGTGREGEILEHRINDDPVTVAAGTVTNASFKGALHIHTRSGEDDQTAIGELTAKFPEWTADHRQRGCAHAALICDPVKQEDFSEVYNNRVPEYSQVRRGAFVYDPRLDDTAVIGEDEQGEPIHGTGAVRLADRSTWPWSDNWALVTADYWAHEDGYGGGFDNVNWASIAQEADHSDAEEIKAGGGTIARWRIWASYSLASEERRRVLADMLKAGDGFAWQDADARFNLMSGRWVEPDVTITDDHILGMTASLGPDSRHRTSAVKVLYTEAATGYREQESATIADPEAEDDPNSDPQAVEAYYVPHHNQAWRLGNIILAQLGDRWRINALLNLYGLNLLGKRFCRLETETLGVYAYFKIDGLRLNLVECTVEATLGEVKPGDYVAPAEPTPPTGTISEPGVVTIEAPQGLTVSTVPVTIAGASGVGIEASWNAPSRPDLQAQAQYRAVGATGWIEMAVSNEDRAATSGVISADVEYEVRARFLTITGRPSAWTDAATITPTVAELSIDFEAGVYRAGDYFAPSLDAVPGYAYSRAGAKAEPDGGGSAIPLAADEPGVVSGGYYSRAAASNLLLRSQDIDNAYWAKVGSSGSAPTIDANAVAAPDGSTTAERINFGAHASSRVQRSSEPLAIGDYVLSVWARVESGTRDLRLSATGTALGTVVQDVAVTTEWQRFSLAFTVATAENVSLVIAQNLGGVASSVLAWQAQLTEGTVPGPIIATTDATAAVGADELAFSLADGSYTASYTFDDDSTQQVPVVVSGGSIVLAVHPTTLDRPLIKRVEVSAE